MADIVNLDDVMNSIAKDAKKIASTVAKDIAKKAQKKIVDEARNNVQKYYDSYSPRTYNRQYKLRRSIIPYYTDKTNNRQISIEVGVQYDSGALKGAYKSNSWYHKSGETWKSRNSSNFDFYSSSNGVPDPDWIMNNFLESLHPITTVSETGNGREYSYTPVKGPDKTQEQMLNEFIDKEIIPGITSDTEQALFDAIIQYI